MIWLLLLTSIVATPFYTIHVLGSSHHHEYSSDKDFHGLRGGLYLVSQPDAQINDEVGAPSTYRTVHSAYMEGEAADMKGVLSHGCLCRMHHRPPSMMPRPCMLFMLHAGLA